MKKEELRKAITKSIEEQKSIIENTNSVSHAAREILGINSTLARTIVKEICNEQGWEIPTWYNRVRYCLNCGKPIIGGDSKKKFCNNSFNCALHFFVYNTFYSRRKHSQNAKGIDSASDWNFF
jgi:NADH pyrophosphatase NudC (nudix superfamily)